MSLRENQVLDRDNLNRAYVSKSATGTQIMAGSLRLLGNLTVDGVLHTKAIEAGSNTIKTTGAITAGTVTATTFSGAFSGSGANITNLNASNLSSGTVNDARLSTNVTLLNKAQTFTANNTYGAGANLYFAGGTTYYVDGSGNAKFNALTTNGVLTVAGNKISMTGGHSPTKIDLTGGGVESIGTEAYHVRIGGSGTGSSIGTKFYTSTDQIAAYIGKGQAGVSAADRLDSRFYGSVSIAKSLEIEGELKTGGANQFPDPLLASKTTAGWVSVRGTIEIDPVQVPPGTNAVASLKSTATAADHYVMHDEYFPVSPNEWITFSAYAFSTTTSKAGQLYIYWYDATSSGTISMNETTFTASTSWTRRSLTAQAPATATRFRVRFDNDGGTGTVMYFGAFQVERGRAMTGFKPYGGGAAASFFNKGIKLGAGGEIHSAHNNNYIFKDHANGNVTVSAAGGLLYLGYQNTTSVYLYAKLATTNNINVIGTDGTLYYKGENTDTRYVNTSGDTMTGTLTIPKLVFGAGVENNPYLQVEDIYDLRMSSVSDITIEADSDQKNTGEFLRLRSGKNELNIISTGATQGNNSITYNGSKVWHEGNDGTGSGLDADLLDGLQPATAATVNTIVQRDASGYIRATYFHSSRANETTAAASYIYDSGDGFMRKKTLANARAELVTASDVLTKVLTVDGAGSGLDADRLDGLDSTQFLRSDTNGTVNGNLDVNGDVSIKNRFVFEYNATQDALEIKVM